DRGHGGGVAVALERPEVVPVRVDGLREIALVADRLRKEPVAGAELRVRLVLGGEALPTQALEVVDGLPHGGPEIDEEGAIALEAIALHDGVDELAVAVVLRKPIGPAPVDAARDVAVVSLMRRIPADELLRLRGEAAPEERRGHDRAVPDPGSGVAPRS